MNAVVIDMEGDTPEAPEALAAQAEGTLVLRASGVVCRALEDTGTITAFALWNGPGM